MAEQALQLHYCAVSDIWNTGKSIEITIKPTITPIIKITTGSISEDIILTRLSISSS
jgi:hypothetical protein